MRFQDRLLSKRIDYIPILGAFDFSAAFPSVIHGWIWAVLKHRKIPQHFLNLFKALYHMAAASFSHLGVTYIIIQFLSGVLQGCPGSAFLFNNALDPFLYFMERELSLRKAGISRACADDIGVTLRRLSHLALLSPIFGEAISLAGLELKPPKCVIVPLCDFDADVVLRIKEWLTAHIPGWANFSIKPATKILGFYLGPKAGAMNWAEPLAKFKARVQCIHHSKASINVNAYTYNAKALPVTSYQAQLLHLPKEYALLERVAMHTVLRMHINALRHADFFQLPVLGGPKLRSLTAACASTLFRTSCKTVTSWRQWVSQLDIASREFLPLEQYLRGRRTHHIWDSQPIALNLQDAFLGFPCDDRWAPAASQVLCELTMDNNGVAPLPGDELLCRKPLQKLIYSKFMKMHFASDICKTIQTRLIDLFAPFTLDFDNLINLDLCIALLRKMPAGKAITILKTWANSWATSHRSHDPIILPCLLGCKAKPDSLIHYLQCPHLYALMKFFYRSTDDNPLIRFGLVNPSLESLSIVCCASAGYHAVRRNVRKTGCVHLPRENTALFQENALFLLQRGANLESDKELSVGDVRHFWTVFAEAFSAEARERSAPFTRFSVASFLRFLVDLDQAPTLT